MTCSICGHPQRAEMERRLASGASRRAIAATFSVGRTSLGRHVSQGHVPVAILVADEGDRETHAVDLAGRVEFLWRRAASILEECEGRPALQLAAVRELRAVCELLAKLTGALELQEHGEVRVQLSFSDDRPTDPPAWVRPRRELVPGKVIDRAKGSDGA